MKLVQLFFLQRGKKALHASVVLAASGTAHALNRAIPGQHLTEICAGKLAAAVTVQNHARGSLSLAGRAKSVDTEFLPHVVIHGKTYDLTVITVQNGCDVKLSVCARDLRDICQPLLIWHLS